MDFVCHENNLKVPMRQSNFKRNRTTFADEHKWRFQFLTILFGFQQIGVS